MIFAPHPALRLQTIQQPAQRSFSHLEDIGELRLCDAVIAEQVIQHPPLGPRQAERFDAAIECRAQQTGDVVENETKIAGQVFAQHAKVLPCRGAMAILVV
jgi:hypothetical protein